MTAAPRVLQPRASPHYATPRVWKWGSDPAHSLGSADCWVPMGPGRPHPKDMASPESSRQHLHLCQRWCKYSAHCPCLHRRKEGHLADPRKDMSQGGDPALAHTYLQRCSLSAPHGEDCSGILISPLAWRTSGVWPDTFPVTHRGFCKSTRATPHVPSLRWASTKFSTPCPS